MINWQNYYNLSLVWIAIAVVTFFYLLFQTAPYGRHSSKKWGPMIDNKLGWFLMEFFVLLVFFFFLFQNGGAFNIPMIVMISFFAFHYLNRSIIFPLRIKTKGKKMPLLIMLSAMCFNLMNGFLLGYYFANFSWYPENWFSDPRFIIGSIIFVAGLILNWVSDTTLINLRKPGETGYKIPKGGMFNLISCPNLLGELIEWTGFAILTWSLPGLAFWVWTFANLVPRAISHHKWYKEKFTDYPSKRKAIFPFIW